MTLVLHFQQENWEALEVSWMGMMEPDAPLDQVIELLELAAEKKVMPRCVNLVREHAGVLSKAGRHDEAAELLGRAMLGGGSPGELSLELYRAAHQAWSSQPWWAPYAEMAGLVEHAPDMRATWRSFRKLLMLREDAVVVHGAGWGMGRVTAIDREALEVEVHFVKGRRDRFPMRTAIDIFDVLDENDLRSLAVRKPEELKRLIQTKPLEVLQGLLRRYNGRVSLALLKVAAAQIGLEGTSFNAWWRRARQLAETSPWFEVSGEATKAQVRLLQAATDPAQGLRRQLKLARSLAQALTRVRELLAGEKLDPALRTAALETLEELAAEETQPPAERLSAWMLLRDQSGQTPQLLLRRLERAAAAPAPAEGTDAPALWRLFQQFPMARDQERCLELLREQVGEAWLEQATANIIHAPAGMSRALVAALLENGHSAEIVRTYASLLARPTRNPHVLITLAETVENGKVQGELPGPMQRGQALLHLAVYLHKEAPGDTLMGRARTRLSTLLSSGKPPLLRRLLAKADRGTLRSLKVMIARGVEDEIEGLYTDILGELAPELFREGEKPYWESTALWTTRSGLTRREADLRELKEVKIPANAEAIGKAAGFGDLSENSEWSAAIEEQRTLTSRAMEIEQEIRRVQLLENAPIPSETVAPGTRVRFRDYTGGQDREIVILGPWDLGDDSVVSYRAPLAVGLLGLRRGDKATIGLPSGEIEVEVLDIGPTDLR